MPLIMENECKKNTFVAPAFCIIYPYITFISFTSLHILNSHPPLFIVVYASSKKVVKKPLEKFIYDDSHSSSEQWGLATLKAWKLSCSVELFNLISSAL